jgi:hypothetical protein
MDGGVLGCESLGCCALNSFAASTLRVRTHQVGLGKKSRTAEEGWVVILTICGEVVLCRFTCSNVVTNAAIVSSWARFYMPWLAK